MIDLVSAMLEANRETMNVAAKRNRWIKGKAQRLFERYGAGAGMRQELQGQTHILTRERRRAQKLVQDEVVENYFGGWDRVPGNMKEDKTRTRLTVCPRRRAADPGAARDGEDFDRDERSVTDLMRRTLRGGGAEGRRRGASSDDESEESEEDEERFSLSDSDA